MTVKNIHVVNLERFLDELIKELIIADISYVQVDNEIHFQDKIYRFYESKNKKRCFISAKEIVDLPEQQTPIKEDLEKDDDYEPTKCPKQNKKRIKIDNYKVNIRFRMYGRSK